MGSNDQYALNWSNHTTHIRKAFDSLFSGNEFVDVTLGCEGRKIGAHKILLSACSTYFHDLFRDNPCQHPIVILKDVKFQNLLDILKFMYNGEVSVATENFDSFLKTAELLQVSGLTEDDNKYHNEKENENVENTTLSVTEQLDSVISPSSKINEIPKEKENPKKRTFESLSSPIHEESTTQKKKKDTELKVDIEIKQEEDDTIVNTDCSLEIKDPLEIGNETIETVNIIAQPAGSQKFADVQDLLNEYKATKVQCPICEKTFLHEYSLKLHLPSHTGNTKCRICGLVLCRIYELKKHMKKKHDISD